jgi:hypothetical protein
MRWGIMRSLLGGDVLSLRAVDGEFTFEQSGIAFKLVGERLGAKDRRRVQCQAGSDQHV